MSKYFKAKIIDNKSLNKDFRLITISPLPEVLVPEPGQFYMLQVSSNYDPLLKRPFSIFKYGDNMLKFLYRIKGKGTSCLSNFKRGDSIYAIGPLGNGFSAPQGDFIAVAGGIGVASLFPLLEKYKNRAYLFYGARNKEELVMVEESSALAKEIFITTEDGSERQKGLVTDLLKDSLFVTHYLLPMYACGPTPMLKELSNIVVNPPFTKGEIKCYVSLEEHMACGVGACLGCAVRVRSQITDHGSQGSELIYERICKEGPVFDLKDIVWE